MGVSGVAKGGCICVIECTYMYVVNESHCFILASVVIEFSKNSCFMPLL